MKPLLTGIALLLSTPAYAQPELESGLVGAVKGCEEWILRPASWSNGPDAFAKAVGLGGRMGLVDKVEDAQLPPPDLRRGNHYWRINATREAGFLLVVSDQLPMCHITGGGGVDLQPSIEAVLASAAFTARWTRIDDISRGDVASTVFRNRKDKAFTIQISRAKRPGQRLDRVQFISTAQ